VRDKVKTLKVDSKESTKAHKQELDTKKLEILQLRTTTISQASRIQAMEHELESVLADRSRSKQEVRALKKRVARLSGVLKRSTERARQKMAGSRARMKAKGASNNH
jgi:hypothetical protein